jgi:hypothetical protein
MIALLLVGTQRMMRINQRSILPFIERADEVNADARRSTSGRAGLSAKL